MSCLGVFFAIDEKTVQGLKNAERKRRIIPQRGLFGKLIRGKTTVNNDIVSYVQKNIEKVYFENHEDLLAQTDKAWDAIQRAFSESDLDFYATKGRYPGNSIVLGGEILCGDKDGEDDYIISLKKPDEVADIYKYLSHLNENQFRELYFEIDSESYGFDVDEQDFEYTWSWLSGTMEFWRNAASRGLYVIFTANQ